MVGDFIQSSWRIKEFSTLQMFGVDDYIWPSMETDSRAPSRDPTEPKPKNQNAFTYLWVDFTLSPPFVFLWFLGSGKRAWAQEGWVLSRTPKFPGLSPSLKFPVRARLMSSSTLSPQTSKFLPTSEIESVSIYFYYRNYEEKLTDSDLSFFFLNF